MAGGEKTEKATPKRKSDERKKGNIFSSKEVATVVSLVIVFYFISYYSEIIMHSLRAMMEYFIRDVSWIDSYTENGLTVIFVQSVKYIAIAIVPILLISSACTIIATGVQTRFLFTTSLLKPKFSRMNPLKGLKNLVSLRALVELFKSLAKIALLAYTVYSTVMDIMPQVPNMFHMEMLQAAAFIGDAILKIVLNTTYLFVVIAVVDYIYQWYEYEKNLKMDKQEIKEEYKQMEGDPQIKGKIKERQRAMSQRRMMQEVPNADVIIRNPTHYAVAIKYESGVDIAPIVLAKGKDLIALKIVEIAAEHDILMMENVPLARGLYESVEIGMAIPSTFYNPVAEVLTWVYKVKQEKKGGW